MNCQTKQLQFERKNHQRLQNRAKFHGIQCLKQLIIERMSLKRSDNQSDEHRSGFSLGVTMPDIIDKIHGIALNLIKVW